MSRRTVRFVARLVAGAVLATVVAATAHADPSAATVMIRVVGEITAAIGPDNKAWRPSAEQREVRLGTGSGVIVSPLGYVVTNSHVIRGGRQRSLVEGRLVEVTFTVRRVEVIVPGTAGSGARTFDAAIVVEDPEVDLAVLHVGGQDLPYLVLSDGTTLERADQVTAWGYPLGDQLEVQTETGPDPPPVSASTGTVSALRAGISSLASSVPYVQMTAPINPGNSGGPLTNADGDVVGIVQAKARRAEGVGFAIGVQAVRDFLRRHALDGLLPVTRLEPGNVLDLPSKGLRFRPPSGFADASPFRLRVHSVESLGPVALVIDRVASSWNVAAIERALLDGALFGGAAATPVGLRLPAVPDRRIRLGLADTSTASGARARMLYAIAEVGTERVVARYLVSADDLAYNFAVLRDSLASLEVAPLVTRSLAAPLGVRLAPLTSAGPLPVRSVPAGTTVEFSRGIGCPGLAEPAGSLTATPDGDFTIRLVATWWPPGVGAQAVGAACGGDSGRAGYRRRVAHLGITYVLDTRVVANRDGVAVRLDVWAPERAAALVAGTLAAWSDDVAR